MNEQLLGVGATVQDVVFGGPVVASVHELEDEDQKNKDEQGKRQHDAQGVAVLLFDGAFLVVQHVVKVAGGWTMLAGCVQVRLMRRGLGNEMQLAIAVAGVGFIGVAFVVAERVCLRVRVVADALKTGREPLGVLRGRWLASVP